VDVIEVTSLLGLIMFPLWMGALIWAYSGAVIGKLYDQPTPIDQSDENSDARTESDDAGETDDPKSEENGEDET